MLDLCEKLLAINLRFRPISIEAVILRGHLIAKPEIDQILESHRRAEFNPN